MATLKKLTRMGADVRQIARLLQAKAPEGHMLAYITPDEAKLLKSQGGSGKEHEDTGVPSFEMEDFGGYDTTGYGEPLPQQQVTSTPSVANVQTTTQDRPFEGGSAPVSSAPVPIEQDKFNFINNPKVNPDSSSFVGPRSEDTLDRQFREAGITSVPSAVSDTYLPQGAFPAGAYAPPEGGAGRGYEPYQIDTAKESSATLGGKYNELAKNLGIAPETLGRLGIAGISSLYGAYQMKQAREDAAAAKREQQGLAAPYQQKGAELQRQAQAGELTPAAQEQLKAVQAQASQAATARGGVGAQQSQAQIEAFRQQLLQQQYDYGLKMSGIGDNIALGAIKTGLEADRYVQQLSNQFYSNVANIAGGMPAQAPQQYQQRTS
jgi:hypothetical protein